jgi:hypothetical protein
VGKNIHPFSRCKHHRGADRIDNEAMALWFQNSPFALIYRFVGILGLFKDSDPVVENDEGEDCNLFNFREPAKVAFGGGCPSITGELTSDRCMPLHQ